MSARRIRTWRDVLVRVFTMNRAIFGGIMSISLHYCVDFARIASGLKRGEW